MDGKRADGVSLEITQAILGILILIVVVLVMTLPPTAPLRSPAMVVIGVLAVAVVLTGIGAIISARRATAVVEEKKAPAAPPPRPVAPPAVEQYPALVLLSLLQEKGRLVDFVMEDITTYTDQQVSAAARVVHQGCREVVTGSFDPAPVSESPEKSTVTLSEGYSAEEYKIVGTVGGEAPYEGKVLHRGWRARRMKLPRSTRLPADVDSPVIVPAEVEL